MNKNIIVAAVLALLALPLTSGIVGGNQSETDAYYTWLDSYGNPEDGPNFNEKWDSIIYTGLRMPACDDCVFSVPIGFDFEFYGTSYDEAQVSTNGFIAFGEGVSSGCCSGQELPNSYGPQEIIAGWWNDLLPGGSGNTGGDCGNIFTETRGEAPERTFTVEYAHVAHYGHCYAGWWAQYHVYFQIVLHESTCEIDILINKADNDGSRYTIGIAGTDLLGERQGTTYQTGTDYRSWVMRSRAVTFTPVNGCVGLPDGTVDPVHELLP